MSGWDGKTSGFAANAYKTPLRAVKDACATAEKVVASANMTPMWTAGEAAADSLMAALTALHDPTKWTFDVSINVSDDALFSAITVSVNMRKL